MRGSKVKMMAVRAAVRAVVRQSEAIYDNITAAAQSPLIQQQLVSVRADISAITNLIYSLRLGFFTFLSTTQNIFYIVETKINITILSDLPSM